MDNSQREKLKTHPANAALNDPQLMKLWGECAAYWDEINQLLFWALDSMLVEDQFVTRQIYFAPENDTAGRKMLLQLLKRAPTGSFQGLVHPKTEVQTLQKIINGFGKHQGNRNALVHGHWGWHSIPQKNLVEIVRNGASGDIISTKSYNKADIEKVRNEFKALHDKLQLAVKPFMDRKQRFMMARISCFSRSENVRRHQPNLACQSRLLPCSPPSI